MQELLDMAFELTITFWLTKQTILGRTSEFITSWSCTAFTAGYNLDQLNKYTIRVAFKMP